MALFIGIIGLPNAGKSTLFNALTQAGAEASAYPFCTIEPNVGVVNVPDPRLDRLAELLRPVSVTPTQIRFVDIAGLVRGASRGEGLGNRFLGHVREADALVHVVRCFDDENVSHVDGSVDAIRDAETIDAELMLADLESARSGVERLQKILRADPRAPEKTVYETLTRVAAGLERGRPVRDQGLDADAHAAVRDFNFLSGKRVLFLANVSDDALPGGGSEASRLVDRFGVEAVLPLCAQIEAEIGQLPAGDRLAFLSDYGLAKTGIDRLIVAGTRLLDLVTFYTTVGGKLQAWQVPDGTSAPRAAGTIHSDMESGFIRAEVAHYGDVEAAGGIESLRETGKFHTEGRDYAIRDGDVVRFLFK